MLFGISSFNNERKDDLMKKLTIEEIQKNDVNTINQFKVLQFLKKELDLNCFDVYLYNEDTIKVIDKNNDVGYFSYNKEVNDITFVDGKKINTEIDLGI